jgi:hypothetical protein
MCELISLITQSQIAKTIGPTMAKEIGRAKWYGYKNC